MPCRRQKHGDKNKVSSLPAGKPARTISKIPLMDPSDWMQRILSEDVFLGILCLERKRAERSPKKLCLLLIEVDERAEEARKRQILKGAVKAVNAARRETDPAGWYNHNEVLGIIFTELGTLDDTATSNTLLGKIHQALVTHLSAEEYDLVRVSIHIFACDSDEQGRRHLGGTRLSIRTCSTSTNPRKPLCLSRGPWTSSAASAR